MTQTMTAGAARLAESNPDAAGHAAGGVTAVERALAIVGCFAEGDESLSLAEIARRTRLAKSTILRLMVSLIRFGQIRRLPDGRYVPGPAGLRMGRLYQRSFRLGDIVYPVMRRLVDRSGESAGLWVRDGEERVCLHRVDSPRNLRLTAQEGDRLPLRGAGGRIILAWSGANDPASERIRLEGVAVSHGETSPESAGVAAPVFGPNRLFVGAIGLTGPLHRFKADTVAMLAPMVREAAAELSRTALGETLNGNIARFPVRASRGGD